jgi:glycine hydroxymethyltransferase
LATRGFGDAEFTEVADIIATALAGGAAADLPALRARVTRLVREFPLYEGLEDWTLVDR